VRALYCWLFKHNYITLDANPGYGWAELTYCLRCGDESKTVHIDKAISAAMDRGWHSK
jgi:hypothetical protein